MSQVHLNGLQRVLLHRTIAMRVEVLLLKRRKGGGFEGRNSLLDRSHLSVVEDEVDDGNTSGNANQLLLDSQEEIIDLASECVRLVPETGPIVTV